MKACNCPYLFALKIQWERDLYSTRARMVMKNKNWCRLNVIWKDNIYLISVVPIICCEAITIQFAFDLIHWTSLMMFRAILIAYQHNINCLLHIGAINVVHQSDNSLKQTSDIYIVYMYIYVYIGMVIFVRGHRWPHQSTGDPSKIVGAFKYWRTASVTY